MTQNKNSSIPADVSATGPASTRAAALLAAAGDGSGRVPPTMLYNEGWMLRLLLDWFDRHGRGTHPLAPMDDRAAWRSEPLLGTMFRPRFRGDKLSESHTHADGVVGHITNGAAKGDIALAADARQFVVVEAKMFSRISAGTTNARNFDQAARNVACMANLVARAGLEPAQLTQLRFMVVAPAFQISRGLFDEVCQPAHIHQRIAERVTSYAEDDAADRYPAHRAHRERTMTVVESWLARDTSVQVISWESLLDTVRAASAETGAALDDFYGQCVRYNGSPLAGRAQGRQPRRV